MSKVISKKINITTIYPSDSIIKQYVDYYYFLNPRKEYLQLSYVAYPNTNHPVIIFENTNVTTSPNHHQLVYDKNALVFCGLLNRFTFPLEVSIEGNIRSINIIFKDAGLNAFINVPFERFGKPVLQELDVWNLTQEELTELFDFSEDKLGKRLDEILLKHYQPFENEILSKAICLMREENELEQIEASLKINRKALLRLFKKYTGISPTDYRRIIRFRQSLERIKDNTNSLTEQAYAANFADQSHFIKELRKLTGDKPSTFAKATTYVSGSKFLVKPQM